MYDRFNDLGIPAVITRTEDVTLNPADRINTIRSNITSSDDIVISNHLNAGGESLLTIIKFNWVFRWL